ncbi:MAG: hypothetical protein HY360_11025 [Verrucomicrobia bacterium]|nr:hypothetical protein [Verrucomicrobiota bacterium]
MINLEERARQFETTVETRLVDGDGLLLSGVHIVTMQPFPSGFFDATKDYYRYPGARFDDFTDFLSYENVGMVTGAYLCAQLWRYRATKDPAAIEKAYRCFVALKHLFDRCQSIAEGFFCKCYGRKITDQLSSDQYLYALCGLDAFSHFAPPPVRQACAEIIGKMAAFWIRKDYTYPYFGHPLKWPLERFPVFAWLAYQHTGQQSFLTEFNRLCALPDVRVNLPFAVQDWAGILKTEKEREAVWDYEKRTGLRVLWVVPEVAESGLLSLEALLEYNAPHRDLWRQKAWSLYDLGRRWIGADGLALAPHAYDPRTGRLTEIRQVIHPGDRPEWKFDNHRGWLRSGMWSAMFARAAVGIAAYHPASDALKVAGHILLNLDHHKLRWFVDVDGQQLPLDMAWTGQVFSTDAVTHWLWAYWEGRAKYGADWVERHGPALSDVALRNE